MEVLRALSLLAAACGIGCQLQGFRGGVAWKDLAVGFFAFAYGLVQASLL
jgi:hypothetical protein